MLFEKLVCASSPLGHIFITNLILVFCFASLSTLSHEVLVFLVSFTPPNQLG